MNQNVKTPNAKVVNLPEIYVKNVKENECFKEINVKISVIKDINQMKREFVYFVLIQDAIQLNMKLKI